MALKVVMDFELKGEGWSEVVYVDAVNIEAFTGAPPDDLKPSTAAGKLTAKRRALLHNEAYLTHFRVSDLTQPGLFYVFDFPASIGKGKYFAPADLSQGPTEVFSSLLVKQRASLLFSRNYYLGGIPEIIVDPPQTYKPYDTFSTVLEAYFNLISTGPYCTQARAKANPATFLPILGFDVSPSGRGARVTPVVRPASEPDKWYVIIRGLHTPVGWNGIHRAVMDTAGPAMILGPTRRVMKSLPAFVIGSGGTIVAYAPQKALMTDWNVVRIVSRRRGRPFGLSRGRR